MKETELRCCVVRDLLPSYLEDLTEAETSQLIKAHLEYCPSCQEVETNMRAQVPVDKAPKHPLQFLKRVKRTRLIAAILTFVVTVFCMWWLYDLEFHYENTEAGRLAAVCDYIPSEGIAEVPLGTPIQAVAWQEIDNHLFIFYMADNDENVHGIMHLDRGINGKYRALEASMDPSPFASGLYGQSLRPKGTDWELFALAGYNCREIYSAQVQFSCSDPYEERLHHTARTYELTGSDFLNIVPKEELLQTLGLDEQSIENIYVDDIRLLDQNGSDITEQYMDDSVNRSWSGGKTTAETVLLYVFIAITALVGLVFIRYFLRRD